MTTITLDIPTSPHEQDIVQATESFISFAQGHPDDLEEIMLALQMRQTDTEPTRSLESFLASTGK